MIRTIRHDERGVASAVATMFALMVVLIFLQGVIVAVVPKQVHDAEFATYTRALNAFGYVRSLAVGPVEAGSQFSAAIPLGTLSASPFASSSPGALAYGDADPANLSISYSFVPRFQASTVTKVDQDVLLVMDSSGSMAWNDPTRLRISGAQQYIGSLTYPDRVAIVDFDSDAHLTRENIGGTAHHLNWPGHDGVPDYSDPQADMSTVDQSGNTNIGLAIQVATNELLAYGDPKHAWVEIVLTDGQNNYDWEVALTRSEAQRAAAYNITIYTIGLSGEADAALLTYVADTTGGTYYAAPTAASIRWIYFEISRRYLGSVSCGTLATADAGGGALSLQLQNSQYVSGSLVLEAGGIAVVQSTGAAIQEGIPFTYTPHPDGTAALSLTLVTFTGSPFTDTGTDYRFLNARVLSRVVADQTLTKISLAEEVQNVANISDYVDFWATQGAATMAAATAITAPLDQASASVARAVVNMSLGNPTGAKFDIDRAQSQLSAAIGVTDTQYNGGNVQRWLANSIKDQISYEACRLQQFQNWYTGITITINSPAAAAWAQWFNQTFSDAGAAITIGLAGNTAMVSIHSVDQITTDRRVVEISTS